MEFTGLDVANGDCFDVMIPRTATQAFAVRNLKIPAELVRQWVETIEQLDLYNNNLTAKPQRVVETKDIEETMEKWITTVELQAKYLEKTGKQAPARYKNDIQWLINKLND